MMEKHRCKLCLRSFSNGRALGGHMKAHLAALPLPPKTPQRQQQNQQESHEEEERLEKSYGYYGLRENPKKSLRFADPELSSGCGSVIQDRESDTDSKSKNPTRPRSKRKRTTRTKPATSTSPCTTPTVSSSVSDTWPEEDVAISLMMLSRDAWMADNNIIDDHKSAISMPTSIIINKKKKKQGKKNGVIRRAKNRCDKCSKVFRSYQAMCGHYKICCCRKSEDCDGEKIFECPYCDKVFGSGQALGGHKRSHQITSTSNSNSVVEAAKQQQQQQQHLGFIDLNLPAPFDDQDDFSVLSDA